MKFSFKKPKTNLLVLMRRLGYHFEREAKGDLIFTRPLSTLRFPRFHLYLKRDRIKIDCNLHLDQKAPSYRNIAAHSGEYTGRKVEQEARRIKESLR